MQSNAGAAALPRSSSAVTSLLCVQRIRPDSFTLTFMQCRRIRMFSLCACIACRIPHACRGIFALESHVAAILTPIVPLALALDLALALSFCISTMPVFVQIQNCVNGCVRVDIHTRIHACMCVCMCIYIRGSRATRQTYTHTRGKGDRPTSLPTASAHTQKARGALCQDAAVVVVVAGGRAAWKETALVTARRLASRKFPPLPPPAPPRPPPGSGSNRGEAGECTGRRLMSGI